MKPSQGEKGEETEKQKAKEKETILEQWFLDLGDHIP